MVQPSAPLPETTQITTALRFGWYFTELRGRHDVEVFRQPRPAIVEQPSLCLGDERTPDEQAAEVAAVVAAAAANLGADPDLAAFGPLGCALTGTTASDRVLELTQSLVDSTDMAIRTPAWDALTRMLVDWDQSIQTSLAVASPRVSAAYQLGRALADVRWSLHPGDLTAEMHGWFFLLGAWRTGMVERLIDRLSPYFADKLTPGALKESVAAWAKVLPAIAAKSLEDAPGRLANQSEIWHDLLLGERSASDLIDRNVESLARRPTVLLMAIKPFRLEIALLALSFIGLVAASWLVFTNTGAPPKGGPMGSASPGSSLVGLAQNIGGKDAVSAAIATASLFGITLAGLSARAKARIQGLVEGIREGIDMVLVADAATLLPDTTWPLKLEGNLYLRFATLRQRLLAVFLDWLVLLVADLIVILATWLLLSLFAFGQLALRNIVVVVTLLMALLYFTGSPAGSGRGLGMWTQRMRILDKKDGCAPDPRQTMLRAISVVVPFELLAVAFWLLPFGRAWAIPLLVAAAWMVVLCLTVAMHRDDELGGRDKRGWHDLLAKTVVVAATDRAYDFATARARPAETMPEATVPTPPAAPVPEQAPAAPTAAAPAQAEPSPVGASREG
ncbi:MAG TPA: RDD family protein [Candidatus Dormibacteraeota bacterium]